MHATKPQILPRNSLLNKKQNENDSNNVTESPNSSSNTNKMKPAIPAKPPIVASKPTKIPAKNNKEILQVNDFDSLKTQNHIESLSNHHSHNLESSAMKIDDKSIVTNNAQHLQQNKKLPIQKSVKEPLIKFRINSNDLNQLRYRKDFFDNKNLIDANNKLALYDVREDEEQINKMNEICELLVAGGYFRARIKGLHNFDKIIGGMCWAIQMCNIDLDIDVFYQENLSIGQKIVLTEKIVGMLQKMKCPFKLEPHQIQGMDCIHIYPVIQWLIKKSLETRQQTADYIRQYSTWQFNRTYNNSDDDTEFSKSVILNDEELVDPIKANLQRRFIHPSRSKLKDEDIRVKTTLLEYGVIGSGSDQKILSKTNAETSTIDKSDKEKAKLQVRQDSESKTDESLLDSMTETEESKSGTAIRVSKSLVGKIVSEQSNEIKRLADDYEKQKAAISPEELEFLREEAKLKEELQSKRKELAKLSQNDNAEKLSALKDKLKLIEAKSIELENTEQNEDEALIKEKLRLTEVLNVLRKQKSELKQHCREEKLRLEKQIEMIKINQINSEQLKDKLKEINDELKTLESKHSNVKKDLSIINKKYAIIQRKFDDIPNRTELAQYQKRFLELYNQLLSKHNETKKFYTLYNTLSDERMYLEKEFNLINSILENFQKASISSLMVKDEFLVKLQQTVETIIQNKNKVEQKLLNEKEKRDQLNQEYSRLIEEQRLYFIAVKAFKEECKINEQLIVKLDKLK